MSGTAGSQRDDTVLLNCPGVSRHGRFFSGKKCVAHALEAAQHWVLLPGVQGVISGTCFPLPRVTPEVL